VIVIEIALLSTRFSKILLLVALSGIAIGLTNNIQWNAPLTPLTLIKLAALSSSVWFTIQFLRVEWRLWNGLDQWPNPGGRYYDQWLKLPEDAGDYCSWLAERMNWREPWASWVRMEKEATALKRDHHG